TLSTANLEEAMSLSRCESRRNDLRRMVSACGALACSSDPVKLSLKSTGTGLRRGLADVVIKW
ncbi:hypothetical protein E4U44_006527, partial [Claviceps purpurea]